MGRIEMKMGRFSSFWFLLLLTHVIPFCWGQSASLVQVYEQYRAPTDIEGLERDDYEDENNKNYADNRHGARPRRVSSLSDDDIIPPNYNILAPPETANGKLLEVEASIIIINIRDFSEQTQDYNMEMNFRLYWEDKRFDHVTPPPGSSFSVLNTKLLSRIWTPDVIIDNVKNVSQPILISKPSSLRIYEGSIVRYSARMTVKMACNMDFQYYPADTQVCEILLRSFDFNVKNMRLSWHDDSEPVRIAKDFPGLSSYNITLTGIENFAYALGRKGIKSWVVRFELRFRRNMYYHMIQTYLPSMLFVIISWLSFLVPPETISARMTMCMSTLLTLTTMFSVVRQNTPNESYAKALDIWMLACISFVFITLVEYTIILKLNSKKVITKKDDDDPVDGDAGGWRNFNWKKINFDILRKRTHDNSPSVTPISYLSWYYIDGKEFVPYQIRRPKLRNSRDSSPMTQRRRHGDQTMSSSSSSSSSIPAFSSSAGSETFPEEKAPPIIFPQDPNKFKRLAKIIDRVSLVVVPGMFIFFNIVYWPALMIQSGHFAHTNN